MVFLCIETTPAPVKRKISNGSVMGGGKRISGGIGREEQIVNVSSWIFYQGIQRGF